LNSAIPSFAWRDRGKQKLHSGQIKAGESNEYLPNASLELYSYTMLS